MNFTEEIYKKKYLKYKAKYLELRGGTFLGNIFLDSKIITNEERDSICKTPNYVIDGCDKKLKEFKFNEKLDKEQRKSALEKIKQATINGKDVKLEYPNGIIYIGKLTNGVPNNYATLKYPNGDTYTGNIKNIIPHGHGVMRDESDEISYEGTFIDGTPKGKESVVLSENNYYGEVLNGKPHGHGEIIYSNGDRYIGYFEDGKKHGYGVFTLNKDDSEWIGTWINDNKGKGYYNNSNE